ncbi:MAG: DNA integrity scanning protein DisA nucleotide-binding domain protein [Candidatus Phytoplasma australasiaticum]|nr:DNA integrity scanning protein DisA nucleotide-binding domain protein [Candidatus Phytoplasma australasiaticum]
MIYWQDILNILLFCVATAFLCYVSLNIFFSKYEVLKMVYCFCLGILFVYFLKFFLEKYNSFQQIRIFLEKINIYNVILNFVLIVPIIIKAPYLRFYIQNWSGFWNRKKMIVMGNKNTQNQILKAVWFMSEKKIGSLITIEKYNTLEQFAQKSIFIDANVSYELLINIFMPNTPLHDGAVIIRGNKILSAGTYFMLSDNQHFEKITGSRHRAALGISEHTDSMTIIVSEETGDISIAVDGIMLLMNDRNKFQEYLTMFMG